MTKEIKTIKVAEYVEDHNKKYIDKITRHDVYKMIKDGKLNAEKDQKGHWVIRLELETKEYTPSKFVEEYNKRHKKETITVEMVRKMAKEGKIKAKKENRKWIILESPRKKIKM